MRPKRVMVVDDNIDAADSLASLLELLGHEVRTLTRGMQVVEEARAFEPHVMFLDISLPDVSGYDLAPELRKLPNLEGLLLIALTGHGQQEFRRRSIDAGFDHHWVKPLDVRELERLLE
jgi:DNA-binding response OmpR family regulator